MNAVIVVPTIREQSINKWFQSWKKEFKDAHVIVVEDNPWRSFSIHAHSLSYAHYSWHDIDQEFGDKSWIFPRRSDCIRSFGIYKAWQQNPDLVITLDDDCYVDDQDFIQTHASKLFDVEYPLRWFQHAQTVKVRGVPKELEKTRAVVNLGLWSNVPDLDASTQIENPDLRVQKSDFSFCAPFGYFVPISGMNLAFVKEAIPAAYFLLMGDKHGIDRFGDIWMGIFLKKICDHLGLYIVGGSPYVRHERASNALDNLAKERPGYSINELLWKDVDNLCLSGRTFTECYSSLADQLPQYSSYWSTLKKAMRLWGSLF